MIVAPDAMPYCENNNDAALSETPMPSGAMGNVPATKTRGTTWNVSFQETFSPIDPPATMKAPMVTVPDNSEMNKAIVTINIWWRQAPTITPRGSPNEVGKKRIANCRSLPLQSMVKNISIALNRMTMDSHMDSRRQSQPCWMTA